MIRISPRSHADMIRLSPNVFPLQAEHEALPTAAMRPGLHAWQVWFLGGTQKCHFGMVCTLRFLVVGSSRNTRQARPSCFLAGKTFKHAVQAAAF